LATHGSTLPRTRGRVRREAQAMAVRAEPRDVYDAAQLYKRNVAHDSERLRRAFLFYAFVDDATALDGGPRRREKAYRGDYASASIRCCAGGPPTLRSCWAS